MSDLIRVERKVFTFIHKHQMLSPGDKVIVGVSGGADSVCLLFLLLEYAKQYPIQYVVAHIHHGIRKEADEDQTYVEQLCKKMGVGFHTLQADVGKIARTQKISEEEAGRKVRYDFFETMAKKYHANKIAVAHNSNDQAETMLFHLFRGTGLTGLCGIKPKRGQIIRPILCLERWEIEEYLEGKEISYCTDWTNQQDIYTRNKIRNHILPYVESEIVAGSVGHMVKTGEMLSEIDEFLEIQTKRAYEKCVRKQETYVEIICFEFLKQHIVVQKKLLLSLLKEISSKEKDFTHQHILSILELFQKNGNNYICLPYGILCRKQYEKVIFELEDTFSQKKESFQEVMFTKEDVSAKGCLVIALDNEKSLKLKVIENCGEIPKNQYTKWFDYDKIRKPLTLRARQTQDFITFNGKEPNQIYHKKIKDYMIGEKIPSIERDNILLLAEENHILWIVGYRISEHYKINKNTKRILQVQLE